MKKFFRRKGRSRALFNSAILGTLLCGLAATGCHKENESGREAKEAPPATPAITLSGGSDLVNVKDTSLFPLTQTVMRSMYSTLNATGSVTPDVSRELPVLSLANGRVVALHVRLGDNVRKGQAIMDVQSNDVAVAFQTYVKTVNDEHLARITLDRDKGLYDKGAIAQTQLEAAQTLEDDARTDLKASEQQLRILGVNKDKPGDTVTIYAPTSGVIINQNATASAAAGITYAGAGGSLTIADLSHVWIVCDVYENDLASVHLGDQAEIRLSAYPGRVLNGTIADIGSILDPSIRTAKIRIQVPNPGNMLRLGMFATATFQSAKEAQVVAVPNAAVLHLHDRAFVFVPSDTHGSFRTSEVTTGRTLAGNMVEVTFGLGPNRQVVGNALELQNAAAQ